MHIAECLDAYRKKYAPNVLLWEKLQKEGPDPKLIQEAVGISRTSYYRQKKRLKNLDKGILPLSKKPRRINKSHKTWGNLCQSMVEA